MQRPEPKVINTNFGVVGAGVARQGKRPRTLTGNGASATRSSGRSVKPVKIIDPQVLSRSQLTTGNGYVADNKTESKKKSGGKKKKEEPKVYDGGKLIKSKPSDKMMEKEYEGGKKKRKTKKEMYCECPAEGGKKKRKSKKKKMMEEEYDEEKSGKKGGVTKRGEMSLGHRRNPGTNEMPSDVGYRWDGGMMYGDGFFDDVGNFFRKTIPDTARDVFSKRNLKEFAKGIGQAAPVAEIASKVFGSLGSLPIPGAAPIFQLGSQALHGIDKAYQEIGKLGGGQGGKYGGAYEIDGGFAPLLIPALWGLTTQGGRYGGVYGGENYQGGGFIYGSQGPGRLEHHTFRPSGRGRPSGGAFQNFAGESMGAGKPSGGEHECDNPKEEYREAMTKTTKKTGGKKTNPWLTHVKAVRDENKGKPLKEILKIAKGSYKKVK